MYTSTVLSLVFVSIALFCIGLVCLSQHLSRAVRTYFVLSITCLILWVGTLYLSNITTDFVLFFNRFAYVAPMFAIVFFGMFLGAAFMRGVSSSSRRWRIASLLTALFGSIVALTPYNVETVSARINDGAIRGYSIVPGPLSWIVAVCVVIVALLLVVQFLKVYSHSDPDAKRPLKVILLTAIVVTVISLVTNVLLPLTFGGSAIANIVNNTALLVLIVIMALSVLRYRFLDIRLAVIRALAYLMTLFATTLLLVLPVVLLLAKMADYHPRPEVLAGLAVTGSASLYLMLYLRSQFDRWTNKLFFRHYYDPQQVLDDVSHAWARTVNLNELQRSTSEIIDRALRPKTIRFLLFSSDSKEDKLLAHELSQKVTADVNAADLVTDKKLSKLLSSHNIALLLTLRTNREELGFMALGYKQSGEAYSTQDIRLMTTVADGAAIAIQNAARFDEIERFNETLQHKIEAATRKLRHTNDKLRTLDQTKDDFISMASHQLRTPLTAVKGYVSMVLDGDAGKLTPLQRKLLNQSFISSQRMVYLISDLLNVSRLRTGKFMIEPVPCNLARVIKDEVEQLQETAKSRNLEMIFNHPEHFPTLMLDETKMRQVIMNFIDNAIYYTPSGGHIAINLVDKPSTIEFTVVDDGIGVPKEDHHHLFTKFFRAHNAKRARPDGTGLGLFMAKKVVVAQGGAIIFRSHEGKGSTFGFTFAKAKLVKLPVNGVKSQATKS